MEKVIPHVHNGTDAPKIPFTELEIFLEPLIAPPAGGSVVDVEARVAVSAILDLLRNKGLMK